MNKTLIKRKIWLFICILVIGTLLVGCSSADKGSNTSKDKVNVSHVLNWFAQPAHAGQYAAQKKGFYEEAGLNVKIEQGGPQVSATQIVASGRAQFGVSQADELLMAVEEGLPLVAVAAAFQTTPQAFAFHKGEQVKDISDFNGRKVFVTPGAGYWEFLKGKYDLTNVQEMAHTGSLVNFIADKTAVAQIFATSEPFILEKEGVNIDMLYLKDTGYSPYTNVIFTTEKVIKENPDTVRAFVEATIKGWNYYYENVEEVNKFLNEVNPDLDVALMEKEAEAQKKFMFDGDGAAHGVGYMKQEPWEEIKSILQDLNLIKTDIDLKKVYTTEFLPYD